MQPGTGAERGNPTRSGGREGTGSTTRSVTRKRSPSGRRRGRRRYRRPADNPRNRRPIQRSGSRSGGEVRVVRGEAFREAAVVDVVRVQPRLQHLGGRSQRVVLVMVAPSLASAAASAAAAPPPFAPRPGPAEAPAEPPPRLPPRRLSRAGAKPLTSWKLEPRNRAPASRRAGPGTSARSRGCPPRRRTPPRVQDRGPGDTRAPAAAATW